MPNRLVPMTGKTENIVSLREFFARSASDNQGQRRLLIGAVQRAVTQELTDKQRRVFLLYYAQQRNIPAIAADLGLNKSTVARHLKVARDRLRRLFSYAMIPLQVEDDLRSD